MGVWLWMVMALVRAVVVVTACYVIATIVMFLLATLGVVDPAAFEDARRGVASIVLIGVVLTMWQAQARRQPADK